MIRNHERFAGMKTAQDDWEDREPSRYLLKIVHLPKRSNKRSFTSGRCAISGLSLVLLFSKKVHPVIAHKNKFLNFKMVSENVNFQKM